MRTYSCDCLAKREKKLYYVQVQICCTLRHCEDTNVMIQFRGTLLECECASGKKSKLITKLSYVSGKEQLKFHH